MKRFIAIIALCAVFPAFADENTSPRTIGARMTCDEIAAEIAKLSADENADADRLNQLQTEQRKNCTKRTMGRRTSLHVGAMPAMVAPAKHKAPIENSPDQESAKPDTADNTAETQSVTETVAETTDVVEPTPENPDGLTDAEIENLNNGLCRDGARPNKFGCCAGEKFMEISDLVFACCPETGDCYPPINKEF